MLAVTPRKLGSTLHPRAETRAGANHFPNPNGGIERHRGPPTADGGLDRGHAECLHVASN